MSRRSSALSNSLGNRNLRAARSEKAEATDYLSRGGGWATVGRRRTDLPVRRQCALLDWRAQPSAGCQCGCELGAGLLHADRQNPAQEAARRDFDDLVNKQRKSNHDRNRNDHSYKHDGGQSR